MKLRVRSRVEIACSKPTRLSVMVEAAKTPDQTVLEESFAPTGGRADVAAPSGNRLVRMPAEGNLEVTYEALVDNGTRKRLGNDAARIDVLDLPLECLPFLLASRYCPSDQFERFAHREFGHLETAGAQVNAIVAWIREHVDYQAGFSDAMTDAGDTFKVRAGVCRDFVHLAITFCRALGIPARMVSAYAWQLDPPDFHAVLEVYAGDQWWLLDVTGLAPIEGLVRIASGRDAADVAFMTSVDHIDVTSMEVMATEDDQKVPDDAGTDSNQPGSAPPQ